MRILVLGGTKFVGRAFVEAALDDGHELTLLHRGVTGADLFPEAEHLLADRGGELEVLAGRRWDACVDVSGYLPRHVRDSTRALADGVERYVYISTISVYADLARPSDESAPLAHLDDETTETIDGGTYGGLKAACERHVDAAFGSRATIVRPGYVVGPHDHTGRFPWWVHRAARGGEVLLPASMARRFQAIDTRDLGAFVLLLTRDGTPGVFNTTGPLPPVTLFDLLVEAARQSGAVLDVVPVDDGFLAAQAVDPPELPLWPGDDPDWAAWAEVDASRAVALGLRFRSIADTVAATLADSPPVAGVGMTDERQAELLAAWRASL